uniref:F-box domain-containing protein n=1 Tax=Panagrellus redivivus TaxID=6233 RepID=A0A7E4UZ06_PANRE
MVHLKSHLLLEVTQTVSKRSQFERLYKPSLIVANLVAAGRRSLIALREVVKCDVWLTGVRSGDIEFESHGYNLIIAEGFLKKLYINWARKLYVSDFQDWLGDLKLDFVKILREKEDIEVLSIGRHSRNNWPLILDLFPKLVSITMAPVHFAEMMRSAPKELFYLEEVRLKDGEGSLGSALEALLVHRIKCPKLETIFYTDDSMNAVTIPDSNIAFPALKHLKIISTVKCCDPLDFSVVDGAKKLFPYLETLSITVDSYCQQHAFRNLDNIEHVYDAFNLLHSDFFIELRYREKFHPDLENGQDLRQFLAAKGKLHGNSNNFTVQRRYLKKALIHEVIIIKYEDIYINVYDSSFNDGLSDDSSDEFSG